MTRPRVDPVHGQSLARQLVKSTVAGKAAVALRRQRRAPVIALRSRRAALRDGPSPRPARGARRSYRAVFLLLCGPGDLEALSDALDSIARYEGDDAKVVVVEDATPDARWPLIAERHPDVDVVRAPWPTGGPPRLTPTVSLGLATALERYDFEVACKMDTDALVCGPGLTRRAAAAFAADPAAGILGTVGVRHDGEPEDYSYCRWVLDHERRASRVVRDLVARAEAGTWTGAHAHGGTYLIARTALDAVAATGDLARRPPWWSQIGEDMWTSLTVCAAGYGLRSWGGPGQPLACASRFLPVALQGIGVDGAAIAVHSVRRGLNGEDEARVRAVLRARRERPDGGEPGTVSAGREG